MIYLLLLAISLCCVKANSESREIELMQKIEPVFVPKDERAINIFEMQQIASENKEQEKLISEKILEKTNIISKKSLHDLNNFIEPRKRTLSELDLNLSKDLVKNIQEALKNHPNNAQFEPDALYYLGLYYFEIDEKDYFARLTAYNISKEAGNKNIIYPEEDFSRTINIYKKLIYKYPSYKHIDSAYYLLALALWYEGVFSNAVNYFKILIEKFPKSKYVPELWFRLGEYYYELEQYDKAVESYMQVGTDSPFYDKALYKSAWAHYQKNRYGEAIKLLVRVVEISAPATRKEAIKYIIKSFSEDLYLREKSQKQATKEMGIKLANNIINYFEALNRPIFFKDILLEAASVLLDDNKYQGAILALKHMLEISPHDKNNPRIENQIAETLQQAGKLNQARDANMALIERYGKNSEWFKRFSDNIGAQVIARDVVRDAMLSVAVYSHKMAKVLKKAGDEILARENFSLAANIYLAYLHDYPEQSDTDKAIYYFAESSFELNRYKTALEAYRLLKDYPLPIQDNIRNNASYNILFTFKHILEEEQKAGRFKNIDFDAFAAKMRGTEEEPIPEVALNYIDAIGEFRTTPADKLVPVFLFHEAAIYYAYGHIEEAMRRFFEIINNYPKTHVAAIAARLIIDDAILKEDWPQASKLAKRFKDENIGESGKDFAKIEGNARFKVARLIFEEANELKKNNQLADAKIKYKESAELFSALLVEHPKHPHADIMLLNSARAVMQSAKLSAAIMLFKKLYTNYPHSEYAKTARFQEALALEKMLKFKEAAIAYDGIIKLDPNSEAAADAMLNKALLYEAASLDNDAIAAFLKFAEKYPNRSEAPDAFLSAASLSKKLGKKTQQIALLQKFIKFYKIDKRKIPSIIEAQVQIAESYGELAKTSSSPKDQNRYKKLELDNYRAALALYLPDLESPLGAFYAAKAQLFLEEPELLSYKKMSISSYNGKTQAEQLSAMMKKLTELAAKNEAIIKNFAQPVWNAEAMYRIGSLYEHLARSMLKAPCPNDVAAIDEFACDEYIILLEDKAAILKDKAIDAYKQSYDIALNAYDTPIKIIDNIQTALNRLRPGKYPRLGNLIQVPKIGALYGEGPMLSTGKMASSLQAETEEKHD